MIAYELIRKNPMRSYKIMCDFSNRKSPKDITEGILFPFSYLCAITLLLCFTISPFNSDSALILRVWITRQYFSLSCCPFICQKILFIYVLPPKNICFCLLSSLRDWTRPDSKSIKHRRKSYPINMFSL